MKFIIIFTIVTLFNFMPTALSAESISIDNFLLEVGQQTIDGGTNYDIGISLLEFPIHQMQSQYIGASVNLNSHIRIWANASQASNSNQGKKFLDSDYILSGNTKTLYLFSESDNDISLSMYDIGISYNMTPNTSWLLSVGAGVKVQDMFFSIYNVHQWEIGREGSDQYVNDIVALTYDVKETIPYALIQIGKTINNLTLLTQLEYSSLVHNKAKDDHVLRSKEIHFESTGTYTSFEAAAMYKVFSNWVVSASYNVMVTETYGSHIQTRYADTSEGVAGHIGDGKQTTTSTQSIFRLGAGYEFY